jgi:hypothetical protein
MSPHAALACSKQDLPSICTEQHNHSKYLLLQLLPTSMHSRFPPQLHLTHTTAVVYVAGSVVLLLHKLLQHAEHRLASNGGVPEMVGGFPPDPCETSQLEARLS